MIISPNGHSPVTCHGHLRKLHHNNPGAISVTPKDVQLDPVAGQNDASEDIPSNTSGNRTFREVLEVNMARRKVVKGTLLGAATSFLAPAAIARGKEQQKPTPVARGKDLVGFEPVSIAQGTANQTMPTISNDYEYQVLIPWGTPIEPGATEPYEGDPSTRPTAEQAAKQIGIGHDGMWFFPSDQKMGVEYGSGWHMSNREGMLCVNHEYGTNPHVLDKDDPESLEDVRVSQHVHGVSVVAITKKYQRWDVVASPNSRRIHVNTPVCFSGPAADSPLLQNPNGNIPLGTVNNCGSGPTPWGTYLTCEENFNGYFGYADGYQRTDSQERYGFSSGGFGYGWHLFDKRFDISDPDYVNESNRFGWVVEIDPFDATQKPVKRTALGRFKHEGVAIAEAYNGRIAAYMGDDQRGDYCYKYVSDKPWRDAIADGDSPLDQGRLYVARFDSDGTGEWLWLDVNNPALTGKFTDQADLLVNTRLAADIVGATKMDRPEWTTIGLGGTVFWTLTNNDRKDRDPPQGEVNAANPENPNTDGHIIRTKDDDDGLGTSFTWEIYILASSTRGTPGVFTDPDAAYADPYGRLFIGTDGGQPDGLQDQLTVFDTTAEIPVPKRLLVGVPSDEVTGWATTPDYRTAFTNLQHPGNGSPSATNFPAPFDGVTIPRDATLVITRKNNGIIGS
jgi:secreted PhoX family phosphatase